MPDSTTFGRAAETYLRRAFSDADLSVRGARRILGGVSRHTWSVDLDWGRDEPQARPSGLIFRLDPPASLLESNRGTEYAVYRALAAVEGIPVPRVLLIEDDEAPLGMPFFVMERLAGSAWPAELLEDRYDGNRQEIVRQMYRILGSLAATDPARMDLAGLLEEPAAEECWARELERWERTLAEHDMGPRPVTAALLRELGRHPPPPAGRVCLVHGDFRIGNVLFEPGRVVGVLDWEMAHLGDPHEDLAWSLAPNWRSQRHPEQVAACLDPTEALAEWQARAGLVVDQASLRWWRLFSHLKAMAIWVTGAHQFATGRTSELVLATVAWLSCGAQERWMLEDLGVPAR